MLYSFIDLWLYDWYVECNLKVWNELFEMLNLFNFDLEKKRIFVLFKLSKMLFLIYLNYLKENCMLYIW